jgi:hypothetical protein
MLRRKYTKQLEQPQTSASTRQVKMIAAGGENDSSSAKSENMKRSNMILSPPASFKNWLQADSFQNLMTRIGEDASGELSVDEKNVIIGSLSMTKKKIRSKKLVKNDQTFASLASPPSSEDQVDIRSTGPTSSMSYRALHDEDVFQVTPVTPSSYYRRSSWSPLPLSPEKKRKPHQPKPSAPGSAAWMMSPSLTTPERKLARAALLPDPSDGEGDDERQYADASRSLSHHNRKASSSSLPELPFLSRAVSDSAATTTSNSRRRPSWTPRPPTLSRRLSMTGAVSVDDPFEKDPFENIPSTQPQNTVFTRRRSLPTIGPTPEPFAEVDDFAFDDPFAALDGDNAFDDYTVVKRKSISGSYDALVGLQQLNKDNAHSGHRRSSIAMMEASKLVSSEMTMTEQLSRRFSEALDLDPFDGDDDDDLKQPVTESTTGDTFHSPTKMGSKQRLSFSRSKFSRQSDSTESTGSLYSGVDSMPDDMSSPEGPCGSSGSVTSTPRDRSTRSDRNSLSRLISRNKDSMRSTGSKASLSTNSDSFHSVAFDSSKSRSAGSRDYDTSVSSERKLASPREKSVSGQRGNRKSRRLSNQKDTARSPKRWDELLSSAGTLPRQPATLNTTSTEESGVMKLRGKSASTTKNKIGRRRSAIGPRTMRIGMDGTIDLINSPNLKEVTCISRVDSFSSQQDVDDAENSKRNTSRRGSTSSKCKKKFFSDSAETVESMTMSKAKAKRRDSGSHSGSHRFHRRASLGQVDESVLMLVAETEQIHMPKQDGRRRRNSNNRERINRIQTQPENAAERHKISWVLEI